MSLVLSEEAVPVNILNLVIYYLKIETMLLVLMNLIGKQASFLTYQ